MLGVVFIIFVVAQSWPTVLSAVTEKQRFDDSILFMESYNELNFNDYDKDMPESCKGETYCTIKTDDYPEKKFNNMLKGYKAFPQPQLVFNPLQNKQGDPNDKNDCASEMTFEPLYKVREGTDKPWRDVVQAPDHDYVQKIRLEKCRKPNGSCFTQFSSYMGYGTYCKQENSYWEILVAKGENETELIKAELPICCSCAYKKNR